MAGTERVGLDRTQPKSKQQNERKYLSDLSTTDEPFPSVSPNRKSSVKNLVTEDKVGKYRTDHDRKSATTDVALVRKFIRRKVTPKENVPNNGDKIPHFLVAGPREYLKGNPKELCVAILTSGGAAPGLNCVINSIVKRHVTTYGLNGHTSTGMGVYGIWESYFGALDLSKHMHPINPKMTEEWIESGGSMLGMRRHHPTEKECGTVEPMDHLATKIGQQLETHGVDILYVIGGNGSLSVAHRIAQKCPTKQIVGVPKTMDNDVFWVSKSFGFDTAVENAAHIINTLNGEAVSSRRICIIEVFGAESGFVAAHSALASGHVDLVLVPEDFETLTTEQCQEILDQYLDYARVKVMKESHLNIVVAEGVAKVFHEKGVKLGRTKILYESTNKEKLFLGQLKKYLKTKKFKTKVNEADVDVDVFFNRPEHYIRSTPANSHDQVFCAQLGASAVDCALAGYTDFMISEWHHNFVLVPLALVADRTKRIVPSESFWKQVVSNTGQPPNKFHDDGDTD